MLPDQHEVTLWLQNVVCGDVLYVKRTKEKKSGLENFLKRRENQSWAVVKAV